MSNKKYIRKNNIIKTINTETNKIISTERYNSINEAKRVSMKLQIADKGRLGNGIVEVQK